MKWLLAVILTLTLATMAYSQADVLRGVAGPAVGRGMLIDSHTNYANTTTHDTTGYVTTSDPVLGADFYAACSEVFLVGVSTDSASFDVNVIGRNSYLTTVTTTYADSFNTTSNTGTFKVITLKDATLDRLAGCTQFKFGATARATLNGTTSGRTLKWYVMWIRP